MKLLLAFVALSVIAIGLVSFANADEPDWKNINPECLRYNTTDYLENKNVTKQTLICTRELVTIDEAKPFVGADQNNTDAEQKTLDDIADCRENNYEGPDCGDPPTVSKPPFVPDEDLTDEEELLEIARNKIDNYCADFRDAQIEILACETYKQIKLCEQGVNESFPVQTHRFFLTTDFEMSIWYHFNYRTGLDYVVGQLQKAKLECEYQRDILEPITLGPRYKDIQEANEGYIQPYHADILDRSDYRVQHQRLTPAVFDNSLKVADETFCNATQFKNIWKQQGCPPKPVKDCHMPTDDELLNIYEFSWRLEYEIKPIKEIYQKNYDECVKKVANAKQKPVGWYDDYINSLTPMEKYNLHKSNSQAYKPGGVLVFHVSGLWNINNNTTTDE